MLVSGSVIVIVLFSPRKHQEALRGVGGLILNADGKRFCNELGRTFATAPMEDGWVSVDGILLENRLFPKKMRLIYIYIYIVHIYIYIVHMYTHTHTKNVVILGGDWHPGWV